MVNNISLSNHSNLFNISPANLVVPPGDFATITITFTPVDPNTSIFPEMIFQSNDPDEGVKEIQLLAGSFRLSPGDQAPNFTLSDLSGNSYSLSDYQGKVVILAFFASW